MSFQDEQNETNIKKIGLLIKKLVFLPVLPPPPTFGGPKKGFVAVGFIVAFFWCSTIPLRQEKTWFRFVLMLY